MGRGLSDPPRLLNAMAIRDPVLCKRSGPDRGSSVGSTEEVARGGQQHHCAAGVEWSSHHSCDQAARVQCDL